MKDKRVLIIFGILFALMISISACGSSDAGTGAQQDSVQNAADQQATVEQVIAEPDSKGNSASLLGEWKDINAKDRFVRVTKVGKDYQYEDNDGKYAATFADGILKVKVTDTETADVYLDTATGHMVLTFENGKTEFEKK